jgi:hypothetical protein
MNTKIAAAREEPLTRRMRGPFMEKVENPQL